jgi:hypothetical protein
MDSKVTVCAVTRRQVWLGVYGDMDLVRKIATWKPVAIKPRNTSKYNPKDCARAGKR